MRRPNTATLHLKQHVDPTPGQPDKTIMPIPLMTALIGAESGAEIAAERLIVLDQAEMAVDFDNVGEAADAVDQPRLFGPGDRRRRARAPASSNGWR